ncbi:MAG TPA: DUF423 domain-containing protein [Caulobacteraceae bacterium]|jgi:uncharacterized membrane protein YgdD (TMEM256/DUF423 family)|nr:DUF423 domain-containing protein [Caulobacteraceae bacterium]
MTPRIRLLLRLAAINGFAAVAAGAFGAHGAAGAAKDWLRTAGEYGLIHSLAVFAAFPLMREGSRAAGVAGWLFLAGAVIFSGSLDVMALSGQLWLGAVTPIGGLLLLAGWATLAFAALSRRAASP